MEKLRAVLQRHLVKLDRLAVTIARKRPAESLSLSDITTDSQVELILMDNFDIMEINVNADVINAPINEQPAADNVVGHLDDHDTDVPAPDHPPAAAAAPAPPGPAVNAIADGPAYGTHQAAAVAMPRNVGHTGTPPLADVLHAETARAAVALASAVFTYGSSGPGSSGGSGIAPGDGDLMPPRFSGDGSMDADDWAKDFRNYIRIRRVTPDFAVMLLENRLTGTARQRLESQPDNLNFNDIIGRFTRRFGMNEGPRNQLLATFWTRK